MIRRLAAAAVVPLFAAGLAAAQPTPGGGAATGAPATAAQPSAAAPADRRSPTAAQTAQQQRMRDCNAQAADRTLRGDARRSFMRECLSAARRPAGAAVSPGAAAGGTPSTSAAPPRTGDARQQRMRDCNAQAAGRNLRGDARRSFMAGCLGGVPASAAPSGGAVRN